MQQLIQRRCVLFSYLFVLFFSIQSFAQTHTPKTGVNISTRCNGYYEYLPQGYDSTASITYPVIFYIPGIGEMGNGTTDIGKLLTHEITKLIDAGTFPTSFTVNGRTSKFIIITPQFKQGTNPSATDVNLFINYILPRYKINQNRIYLTGLSYGGGLAWAYPGYNSTYANRIAAIVPVASPEPAVPSGQTEDQVLYSRARNIAGGNVAVWALHNRTDANNPLYIPQTYVNYINQAPAPDTPAKLTIFEQSGHTNTWPIAYSPSFKENGMNVYEWMLQFHKGAAAAVNAGTDKTLTLPANSVAMTASATDADGYIESYAWSKTSGPSQFTISNAAALNPTISNLVQGTYTFKLTVTDNDGAVSFDNVTVTVNAAPASAATKYIKVNIFGGTNPYNNAQWNNWNVTASLNSGTLNYSDATASSASATLSASNSVSDNGSTYGGTMAPPEVIRYTSSNSPTRTLNINGLSATKTYNIELYASRNTTGNSTTFSTGGSQITILTDKNKTNKALFTGLTPTAGGQITVTLQSVNTFNYINGFVLTENGDGAPTANAGADKNITLPTNSVTLNGSATDPDGTIASYSWSKVSGPAAFAFSSTTVAAPTVSNLAQGIYTFRLTVTDNNGELDTDDVVVTVNAAPVTTGTKYIKVNIFGGTNPYANAEWNNWNVTGSLNSGTLNYSDATVSSASATLSASNGVSDNGSTYGGTMAPPEVIRYTSSAGATRTLTINGLSTGKLYDLELYASRNNTGNSTRFTTGGVQVTILTGGNKANKASFTNLTSTAGGQIVVTIQNVNSFNYINGFTITEKAGATVTANAGTDKNITLPTNSVTLTGSGSAEGTITAYNWTKISGPASFSIANPTSAITDITGLAEGAYTFRLTVTDNNNATATDDVLVVVNAMPPPSGTKFINVNIFGGTNPYNNTQWNNWNVSGSLASGALNYSDATASGISGALTASHGITDNGATYGGGMAPAEVLRYVSSGSATRTLTLNGLSTSKTYSIEFYGSRNSNSTYSTSFTINGVSSTVATYQNLTQKALFTNLSPTVGGQIIITIKSSQAYNYLNGFSITEMANNTTTTSSVIAANNIESVSVSTVEAKEKQIKINHGLSVFAIPNPARQHINLQIKSSDLQPVNLRIFNAAGLVVAVKQNIAPTSQLSLGANFKPGTYYVEVVQGKNKKTIQVVKLP